MKKIISTALMMLFYCGIAFSADFNAKQDSLVPDYKLVVKVTDREKAAPLSDVKVKITDNISKKSETLSTAKNGEAVKILNPANKKVNLTIQLSKEGFVSKSFGYDTVLVHKGNYVINADLIAENFVHRSASEKDNAKSNAASKKEYIIIVGSYTKQSFADMTIKDLKKQGYKVYTKNKGTNIRVGAIVNCTESALDAEKNKLKKKYPLDLWVLPESEK